MATLWTLCCEGWSFSLRTKITFLDFRDDFGKKFEGRFTTDLVDKWNRLRNINQRWWFDMDRITWSIWFGRYHMIVTYLSLTDITRTQKSDMNCWRNLNAGGKNEGGNLHHQNQDNHKLRKVIFRIMDLSESWNFLWRCHAVSYY